MTISPEALRKARAITHMFCLFPPSDKQALEIQIAAALQAERDAAAPKLPDDLAGLVRNWRTRAENARMTLDLKAREAAKGHDWVVAHDVVQCTEVVAVASALQSQAAEIEKLKIELGETLLVLEQTERNAARRIAELEAMLDQLAEPYFWTEDGFEADASTPHHRSSEMDRRLMIARRARSLLNKDRQP